jgi:hypothetical protein
MNVPAKIVMDLSKISRLYKQESYALELLLKAKKNGHPFFRNEESFSRLLKEEIEAALRRVSEGVPHMVFSLENTLSLDHPKPDFVVGRRSSFEAIQLQVHLSCD